MSLLHLYCIIEQAEGILNLNRKTNLPYNTWMFKIKPIMYCTRRCKLSNSKLTRNLSMISFTINSRKPSLWIRIKVLYHCSVRLPFCWKTTRLLQQVWIYKITRIKEKVITRNWLLPSKHLLIPLALSQISNRFPIWNFTLNT